MKLTKAVASLAAALLLAACATTPPQPTTPSSSASAAELAALRERFGLPDCPVSDPDAKQIPGGLPETHLTCLGSSREVNLAGLAREPMIINVWAQWCAPCRQESPFLRAASERLDGVTFLGINYDDDKPDWALEFASLARWDYPHVVDRAKTLQAPLKVPGVPTTYFVAADGTIAGVHPGVIESEQQLLDLAHTYLGAV